MVTTLQVSNGKTLNNGAPLTMMLLGAAPTSTNRGVAALGTATIDNLTAAFPSGKLIVEAGGLSENIEVQLPERTVSLETSWLNGSSKLKPKSGATHLRYLRRLSRWLPGLGSTWLANRTYQQLDTCSAVLDIAGGDSFADTYGAGVLSLMGAVKRLAFSFNKPLILLPQTIGPFRDPISQRIAKEILAQAALVVSRDVKGLDDLEKLLGSSLDNRFVTCPDVAFTLRPKPIEEVHWPWDDNHGRTIIGLNVSGLLWRSNVDFGLAADYQALTRQLIEWAMRQDDARLLLVPHVFNKRQVGAVNADRRALLLEDSDIAVSLELRDELQQRCGDRVDVIKEPYEAAQLKWIIGHCDFFIGARMHACIAAVSQAVPTVTLAYSKKAAGVMGMLDPVPPVVDLRQTDADAVVSQVQQAYRDRSEIHDGLVGTVTDAQRRVHSFFRNRLPRALGLTSTP